MKKVILLLMLAIASIDLSATIHLSYEKGTGGPTGTGRAETECSPSGCATSSACTDGYGACLNEGGFNDPCPTYQSVLNACPGAARVWLANLLTNEVEEVWDAIENGTDEGSYNETYYNVSTGEWALVNFSWEPRSPGSDVYDITVRILQTWF